MNRITCYAIAAYDLCILVLYVCTLGVTCVLMLFEVVFHKATDASALLAERIADCASCNGDDYTQAHIRKKRNQRCG